MSLIIAEVAPEGVAGAYRGDRRSTGALAGGASLPEVLLLAVACGSWFRPMWPSFAELGLDDAPFLPAHGGEDFETVHAAFAVGEDLGLDAMGLAAVRLFDAAPLEQEIGLGAAAQGAVAIFANVCEPVP